MKHVVRPSIDGNEGAGKMTPPLCHEGVAGPPAAAPEGHFLLGQHIFHLSSSILALDAIANSTLRQARPVLMGALSSALDALARHQSKVDAIAAALCSEGRATVRNTVLTLGADDVIRVGSALGPARPDITQDWLDSLP